jgi:prepilin-type N-terminal cleavage/methylation domain-containing protein/prepilin-type processing-associated H-X9-DG protein
MKATFLRRRGFTLVELLVVIGIIALLVGILLPALSRARQEANATKCMSNLHQIALGMVMYTEQNHGCIIPAYNLPRLGAGGTNFTAGPSQPMEGWACILVRDGFIESGSGQSPNSAFYCPDTYDIQGMAQGQTGTNPALPRGWTDWPMIFTATGGDGEPEAAVTIPARGFNDIIRVSYWMNAYNPIGGAPGVIPAVDVYYSTSVGVGPDPTGAYLRPHKAVQIQSADCVALADGVYMGRQSSTQLGQANSRIGYRHPGMGLQYGSTNVAFADGHVQRMNGDSFPQALSSSDSAQAIANKKTQNLNSGATVYANPTQFFH